jgi:endonuclease/exonuclease/phosphatase (EEP) superfamily protein YafD
LKQLRLWSGLVLLLLAMLCSGGLAALCPEDVLWLSAVRAVLLSLPRPMMLLVAVWGLLYWRRSGKALGGGFSVAAVLLAGIPPIWPASDDGLLLVSANVQAYADEPRDLELALGELGADVLITQEKRGARVPGMQRIADNYDRDLSRTSHGAAVYCAKRRFCTAEITEEFGTPACGMPVALVRVEADLCVIGVHVPPPIPVCASGLAPYLDEVAKHVDDGRVAADGWGPCEADDPVIVTGDLNYVPGSRAWHTMLDQGLRDTARWQGVWAASWPAGGGWPYAPFFRLDHMLAGDVTVRGVRYFGLPGADHRAVRARVILDP